MVEQYTYAVSRIHARELDLLSSSDLEQLLICPDFETALKYLTEKGYGIKDNYRSFEELEKDETEKMWELINELIPDKTPFETLLRQIDFHNLKAAIKSVFTAEEAEGYFLRGGIVEPQVILNAVKIKNYSELPEFLSETAVEATEKFAETGDGQECDIYIDRRCLETILSEGTASDISIIKDYAELFVALSDIKIAARGALTKKSKGFMQRALAECETLDVDTLAAAAGKSTNDVYKYLEHTSYKEAAEKLSVSMSEFEKWTDNKIMDLIKSQKSNPFTVAPIFSYILAKQNELKAVQIILSGKKNNLPDELIRERIRDLYV